MSLAPQLRALLDACRDQYDEDVPRLVLADWLEEHGDDSDQARAEFIRLQVEHTAGGPGDPGRVEQEERIEELRERFEDGWVGELAEGGLSWEWQRGLLWLTITRRNAAV